MVEKKVLSQKKGMLKLKMVRRMSKIKKGRRNLVFVIAFYNFRNTVLWFIVECEIHPANIFTNYS